jgi:regulatory protein
MSDSELKIRVAAMNLLARREHSRLELQRKLDARFSDCADLVREVLNRLTEQGLQSDRRFAESYGRSRVSRGYGAQRIRLELRDKGVEDADIHGVFAELNADWFELARQTLQKKFGARRPADFKSRAKCQRFLHYRGFSNDQIRYAIESEDLIETE